MIKTQTYLLAFVLLVLTALACNPGHKVENANNTNDALHKTLTIYAAKNEHIIGPLINQFTTLCGIDVEVKYGGTSAMAATILEEGNKSKADVFLTRDPGGLGAVQQLFMVLPTSTTNLVPNWASSTTGRWVGISARARTLVYNTDNLIEKDLPSSIFHLIDPKWKNRIGWSPTSGPTVTMITAMRLQWGEERTRKWLKGIKENKATSYMNHTSTVAAVMSGEVDLGLVNHYYLHRFLEEQGAQLPARNYHFPEKGPGNLIMISGAGILSTSDNQTSALKFLEFLLSPESQTYVTNESFEYPLRPSIQTNPLLVPISEIQKPNVGMEELSDIQGTLELMRNLEIIP